MAYDFVNPYNFIPLSKYEPDRSTDNEAERYSGCIEYSLLTKSPLFIPNTSNDDAFKCGVKDHKSYDFFSYDDLSDREESVEKEFHEPVIPGSEIRGMIRSNFEILTNSCLSSLDSDTVMAKRTLEVYKAGLIKKTEKGFEVYEAEDCLLRTKSQNCIKDDEWESNERHYSIKSYIQNDYKEGQKVTFEYVRRPIRNRKGIEPNQAGWASTPAYAKPLAKNVDTAKNGRIGYILKGSDGPDLTNKGKKPVPKGQKHCCHVFTLKEGAKKYSVNINVLEEVLRAYNDRYIEFESEFKKFKKGEGEEYFPVYFNLINLNNQQGEPVVYLSPASITREAYERMLSDMVGGHYSCRDKNALCPACRLFGTIISGNRAYAKASRIRFSDMIRKSNSDCYMEPFTLEPLASPKLNNMEFYLERPEDAVFWTYDYFIDSKGKLHKNTYGINGRKFYWHNLKYNYNNEEKTNINITVRPLKPGQVFEGKVYFESITSKELNQLIFVLNVGEENDELVNRKNGYKLGAAKPIGMGSVALSINSVSIREYVVNDETKSITVKSTPYNRYGSPNFDDKIITDYLKMTSFDAVKNETVDYPRTEKQGNIFDWFTSNHKAYDKNKNKSISSPTMDSRKFMYFEKYMKPMETELASTGVMVGYQNAGHSERDSSNLKGSYKNSWGNDNKAKYSHPKFLIGKEYDATVNSYNSQKTLVFLRLKQGGTACLTNYDIHCAPGEVDKALTVGTRVKVKYIKNDGKYDKWKLM